MADYQEQWLFSFEVANVNPAIDALRSIATEAATAAASVEALATAWGRLTAMPAISSGVAAPPAAAASAPPAASGPAPLLTLGSSTLGSSTLGAPAPAPAPAPAAAPVSPTSGINSYSRVTTDSYGTVATETFVKDSATNQWLRLNEVIERNGQITKMVSQQYQNVGGVMKETGRQVEDFTEGMTRAETITKQVTGINSGKTTGQTTMNEYVNRGGKEWLVNSLTRDENGNAIKAFSQEIVQQADGTFKPDNIQQWSKEVEKAGNNYNGFMMRLGNMATWFAFYEGVHLVTQAIMQWSQVQSEMSMKIAEFQMTVGGGAQATKAYVDEIMKISQLTNINPVDVAEGVTLQKRVGARQDVAYRAAQIERMAPEVDHVSAERTIIALSQQYPDKSTLEILDAFSGAWSKSALSMGEFFSQMDTAAPAAKEFNTTLESMMGFMAGVTTVTGSSAQSVEQFTRRMGSVYTDPGFRAAVEKYTGPVEQVNLSTGQTERKAITDIFGDIAALSTTNKAAVQEIASTIQNQLGQPTRQIFMSMINSWSNIDSAIQAANNSQGAFARNAETSLDTYKSKLDAVGSAWERLLTSLGNTSAAKNGLTDLARTLDIIRQIVNDPVLSKIISAGGSMAFAFTAPATFGYQWAKNSMEGQYKEKQDPYGITSYSGARIYGGSSSNYEAPPPTPIYAPTIPDRMINLRSASGDQTPEYSTVMMKYNELISERISNIKDYSSTSYGYRPYKDYSDEQIMGLKGSGMENQERVWIYDEQAGKMREQVVAYEILTQAIKEAAGSLRSLQFMNMPKNVSMSEARSALDRATSDVESFYSDNPSYSPKSGTPQTESFAFTGDTGIKGVIEINAKSKDEMTAIKTLLTQYLGDISSTNTDALNEAKSAKSAQDRAAKAIETWTEKLFQPTKVTQTELYQADASMKGEPTGPTQMHWDERVRRYEDAVNARINDKGGSQLFNRGDEKDPAMRGHWGGFATSSGDIDLTNKATASSTLDEYKRKFYSFQLSEDVYTKAEDGMPAPMDALLKDVIQRGSEDEGKKRGTSMLMQYAKSKGVNLSEYIAQQATGETGQFDAAYWGTGGSAGAATRAATAVQSDVAPKVNAAIQSSMSQVDFVAAFAKVDAKDNRLIDLGVRIGDSIRNGITKSLEASLVSDIANAVYERLSKDFNLPSSGAGANAGAGRGSNAYMQKVR